MSAAFWSSLFTLRDRVDQQASSAGRRLGELRRSAEPETPAGGVILSRLHLDVRQELESWRELFLAPASEPFGVYADSARCLRLVAFWVNERVRSQLDAADQGDFLPVGPSGVDLSAGGVLFFDDIEGLEGERLRAVSTFAPPSRLAALELSAALALFVLEQGFEGVYFGSAARLEPIKARLRHRQLPPVRELPSHETIESPTSVTRVALWVGLVVCFYACCAWLSSGWGSA